MHFLQSQLVIDDLLFNENFENFESIVKLKAVVHFADKLAFHGLLVSYLVFCYPHRLNKVTIHQVTVELAI